MDRLSMSVWRLSLEKKDNVVFLKNWIIIINEIYHVIVESKWIFMIWYWK